MKLAAGRRTAAWRETGCGRLPNTTWFSGSSMSWEASRKDPAVRAKRFFPLVTLVFQVTRMPYVIVALVTGLIGVHRVVFEIARRNPLFQRDRKALAGRVCGAVGELCQVVEGHRRHRSLAEVVVAHVQTPRVDAELPGVFTVRPRQVVIDLPLGDLAALRVGIVIAADRREWNAVAASDASTMGKVLRT